MTSFRRILVPIDFSEHSDLALQTAAPLSRSYEAPLTILYVNEPLVLALPEGSTIFTEAQLGRMLDWCQEQLETAKRAAEAAGALSVQALMLHGFAAGEIQRFAAEGDFDLIVMGTHGRSGLSHALLGSVAERVVRTAPCPVLSVRVQRKA